MPKYLLIYQKGESVRWLGHLDILRTVERAIRRASLPIAFSNGFNPREKVAFASALGTGITGSAERVVLELTEALPDAAIQERLNEVLPPGIHIEACGEISDAEAKDSLSGYDRAEYEVVCAVLPETTMEQVAEAVQNFMAQAEAVLRRERQGKSKIVDIRPNVYALTVLPQCESETRLHLNMIVGQGESGTAKPSEVVEVLAAQVPGLTLRRTHRVRLVHGKEDLSQQ